MKSCVKKRELFYLAGYDPRGARYYYNLYKKESHLQSKINGMKINISSRKRTANSVQSWYINSIENKKTTLTNYHYMEWDDIIRKHWTKSSFSLFLDLLFYFKIYILGGLFFKYIRTSPRQMFGIFYPIVYMILSLYFAYLGSTTTFFLLDEYLLLPINLTLSLFFFLLILYSLVLFGNKMVLFWLVRIFVFSAKYVLYDNKELESRIDIFSKYINTTLQKRDNDNVDEILIVAHSVGTILTIPLIVKVLEELKKNSQNIPNISVLTLGECIPLVSGVIPESKSYIDDMKYVASQENLYWLDYTTVIDGACFPYLNYFKDSNINITKKKNFHFLSARFHTLFLKKRYSKLRRNKYLTHFAYLMSTELPGGYDYFKMTAGHNHLKSYFPKKKKL